MRALGYIIVNNKTIKVLFEDKKYSRLLRLRLSGRQGLFLKDESYFLETNKNLVDDLLNNHTIEL